MSDSDDEKVLGARIPAVKDEAPSAERPPRKAAAKKSAKDESEDDEPEEEEEDDEDDEDASEEESDSERKKKKKKTAKKTPGACQAGRQLLCALPRGRPQRHGSPRACALLPRGASAAAQRLAGARPSHATLRRTRRCQPCASARFTH
jgi:hypothetical protein